MGFQVREVRVTGVGFLILAADEHNQLALEGMSGYLLGNHVISTSRFQPKMTGDEILTWMEEHLKIEEEVKFALHHVTTVPFILPHMCPKFSVSTVDCSHLGNHAGGYPLSSLIRAPKLPFSVVDRFHLGNHAEGNQFSPTLPHVVRLVIRTRCCCISLNTSTCMFSPILQHNCRHT